MSEVDTERFSAAYEHTNRIVVPDHDGLKVFGESQFNEDKESKDITGGSEDTSRMRAEEEVGKLITICKEYPHEWERLWSTLRDVRTDMIRSGLWKGPSEGLGSRNFRPESPSSIESDQEDADEAVAETRLVSCIQTRRYTPHNYHKDKLRLKADWLRKVVSDASVKKKSTEDRKSKVMDVRQRQIAHSLQKQSEITK